MKTFTIASLIKFYSRDKSTCSRINSLITVFIVLLFSTNVFSQAFDLDQGENGGKPTKKPISAIVPVSEVHWVNSNLGGTNSHFMEGYSVPYRAKLTGLTANTDYVIRIGFDIRVGGKWALDYITGARNYFDHDFFNHFEPEGEVVDPLLNPAVAGVSGSPDLFDIPDITYGSDAENTTLTGSFGALNNFNGSEKKKLALYGGTISDAFYQSPAAGGANLATFTSLEGILLVRFTTGPTNTSAVLAWGGHIASLVDWPGQSASDINGSPYHMRIKGFGVDPVGHTNDQVSNGGNTDRSLKTDAVIICSVNGGTVGSNQSICAGDNVAAFTNTTLGTGNGTITYKWQKNTTSCAADAPWADISGATSATYDEGVLSTAGTYYYRRLTTSTGDLTCTAPSNCITITVNAIPSAPSVTYNYPACDENKFSVTVNSPVVGASYCIKDKNGANISGVSPGNCVTYASGTLRFSNIPAGSGYQVTVTVGGCTSIAASCPVASGARLSTDTYQVQIESKTKVIAAPNPFNDRIRFTLQSDISGQGSLEIYNMLGQKIRTVFQGYIEKGIVQTTEYRVPGPQRANLIYVFRVGDQKVSGKLIGLK